MTEDHWHWPIVFDDDSTNNSLSDFSSVSRQADSCNLSSGSTVCCRMLLSSSGTLVQSCIGAISRSVSNKRWHRRSCSHHYNTCVYASASSSRMYLSIINKGIHSLDHAHCTMRQFLAVFRYSMIDVCVYLYGPCAWYKYILFYSILFY